MIPIKARAGNAYRLAPRLSTKNGQRNKQKLDAIYIMYNKIDISYGNKSTPKQSFTTK